MNNDTTVVSVSTENFR